MQRILFALPLLVAGCNSGVGTTGGDSTSLKAGIYTGTIRCELTDLLGNEAENTKQLTVIVSESGLPTWNGQELAPGVADSTELGESSVTRSITDVEVSENGVVVGVRYEAEVVVCLETCPFGSDGECDDGGPGAVNAVCEFGTDCFDCGVSTVELTGEGSATYKKYGQDRLDYRSSAILSDVVGSNFVRQDCQGVLAP